MKFEKIGGVRIDKETLVSVGDDDKRTGKRMENGR